jgi:hypothetical protein
LIIYVMVNVQIVHDPLCETRPAMKGRRVAFAAVAALLLAAAPAAAKVHGRR